MTQRFSFRSLLADLRSRHVFRVAAIYLVAAWLAVEVASTVFPLIGLPGWTPTLVLALLAVGFPVAIALAWAYDVTPDGVRRAPEPAVAQAAGTDTVRPTGERTDSAAETARPTGHQAGPKSLAVLPFVDLSRDRDQEYLGDGVAEEILNVLAQVRELRVAARTSSFAFKGRNVDVREIGRQLGVDAVLEGSVRTAGGDLRVTAQLIGVEDGYHIWSRRFDRDLSDVFAVQDEIAAEIAAALQVERPGIEPSAKTATEHLDAYTAYLKGRHAFHRKTGKGLRQAKELFLEAIAIDPRYAPAHAGLADTCAWLYTFWEPTEENRRTADESSRHALELAPALAEAHVARGTALALLKRYDHASAEFDVAIRLEPRSFDAWYFRARAAFAAADREVAAEAFARAEEIQPEAYDNIGLLSMVLAQLGRDEEALAARRRSLAAANAALRINPEDVRALYFAASNHVTLGDPAKGVELADRAAAIAPDDSGVHYNIACTFSLAGQIERALDHLERAVDLGYSSVEWIERDADFEPVRDQPRYAALIERMKRMREAGRIDA